MYLKRGIRPTIKFEVEVKGHHNVGAASACDGFEEQGVMIAAASDEFWDNGAYEVSCVPIKMGMQIIDAVNA
ncbi:hypothetical protein RJ640_027729 [Escallonia rubra]|uniref:Uncharacterized protein n=1 Tax=Escallonia rubra TaxID=112253 RepID=A0AA88R7K1_9ASTE|nr:hypothetical protein RJ640_027729 [Escallonia rubra]